MRYPENHSPFRAQLPEEDERFAELREDFLLGYSYHTACAYWGDLEHLKDWCLDSQIDVLSLTETDLDRYVGWLSHIGYSASTARRRRSTWRAFSAHSLSNTGISVAS